MSLPHTTQFHYGINLWNYTLIAEPCELYCSDEKDTIIVPRGGAAKDGTPCRVGTRDMCIGGICKVISLTTVSVRQCNSSWSTNFVYVKQKVGCDWTVDSDAKEDKCGVCHGNGEQCDTILGFYNTTTGSGEVTSHQINKPQWNYSQTFNGEVCFTFCRLYRSRYHSCWSEKHIRRRIEKL